MPSIGSPVGAGERHGYQVRDAEAGNRQANRYEPDEVLHKADNVGRNDVCAFGAQFARF